MSQRAGSPIIMQRADAIAAGKVRYFTGKPCRRGHVVERLTSNCSCLGCVAEGKSQKDRLYYEHHADAVKARIRARWRSNPDAKAQDKASRDRKREKIRAYDRMRAKRDRAKKKVIIERWIVKNRERHLELRRASQSRRRARKLGAAGNHTATDVARLLKGQKHRCWWCNKKLHNGFHVDHRIPLAKGGGDGPDNLVISCAPCNWAKNVLLPQEFAGRLF